MKLIMYNKSRIYTKISRYKRFYRTSRYTGQIIPTKTFFRTAYSLKSRTNYIIHCKI